TRFRRHDGQADPPPRNIFAAQKIIACVALVFAEPDSEADDADQIQTYDQPVSDGKIRHVENAFALLLKRATRISQKKSAAAPAASSAWHAPGDCWADSGEVRIGKAVWAEHHFNLSGQ